MVGRRRWRRETGRPDARIHRLSRRPRLTRLVAVALIAVSLVSVVIVGVFTYARARSLLTSAVEAQLSDHQAGQVRAIRNGLDSVRDAVALIARSRGTVEALTTLAAGYGDLEGRGLPAGAEAATVEDLPATSGPGRYLQYHYIVQNPFPADQRHELVRAPGDATAYGRAHVRVHPGLEALRTTLGFGDLLLVDAAGANVVYTTDKRPDLGTDLVSGPYADSGLADAVTRRLARSAVGETVLVDFEEYEPAGGDPVMFVAAAVSDGTEVVGAVAAELPIDALNAITTVGGEWAATGLGETGETYVVGPDRRMRSDSRRWLEDPEGFVAALERGDASPGRVAAIVDAGTTVLLQPVRTEAVAAALDGERFVGRTQNYLGDSSLTIAGPLGVADLGWVVVADVAATEADRALATFTWRLVVVAAVLVPAVALLGWVLARRMTRPVQPVVVAAATMAEGQLDTSVPELGRNEVGDVGRRLNTLAGDLREWRAAREAEEQEITDVLTAVLPERLVSPLRRGDIEVADLTDSATVVAVTVDGPLQRPGLDQETAVELSARLSRDLEAAAEQLGLERIRSASDRHLFVAGLGRPDAAVDDAARFALGIADVLDRFEHETGVSVDHHAGLGSGDVASGLLSAERLTYGVFGEPLRVAMALDGVAADGQVLVDAETAKELVGPGWTHEPVSGLIDLRGNAIEAVRLIRDGVG